MERKLTKQKDRIVGLTSLQAIEEEEDMFFCSKILQ
jgi:hypothetical protein